MRWVTLGHDDEVDNEITKKANGDDQWYAVVLEVPLKGWGLGCSTFKIT